MIVRIVKMTFQESKIDDFKSFSKSIRDTIRGSEGCEQVDILQDIHHKNTFFTYSIWQSEKSLNAYRRSDFFRGTWRKVREWFADKPDVWSLETLP